MPIYAPNLGSGVHDMNPSGSDTPFQSIRQDRRTCSLLLHCGMAPPLGRGWDYKDPVPPKIQSQLYKIDLQFQPMKVVKQDGKIVVRK